jgi:hypothetical protein
MFDNRREALFWKERELLVPPATCSTASRLATEIVG